MKVALPSVRRRTPVQPPPCESSTNSLVKWMIGRVLNVPTTLSIIASSSLRLAPICSCMNRESSTEHRMSVLSRDEFSLTSRDEFSLTSRYVMQYAALQLLLSLRTHRFFRPLCVTEVLSQSGSGIEFFKMQEWVAERGRSNTLWPAGH